MHVAPDTIKSAGNKRVKNTDRDNLTVIIATKNTEKAL